MVFARWDLREAGCDGPSLVPQSLQRIDAPCSPRRRPACQRGDDREHQPHRDQSDWIGRLHIEEERLQHARQQNRRDNPSDDAARDQLESLTEHQFLNIAPLRSQAVRIASSRFREATDSESTP